MPWFKVLERIQLKSRVLTTVARVGLRAVRKYAPAAPELNQSIMRTWVQVGADQFIAAPCLVGLFFTAMPVLEGKPHEIKTRLAEVMRWRCRPHPSDVHELIIRSRASTEMATNAVQELDGLYSSPGCEVSGPLLASTDGMPSD